MLFRSDKQYDDLIIKYGAESNGLENVFYHIFKNLNVFLEPSESFDKFIESSFDFEDFSMVEYYTILPTDVSNHFCPYIHISNNKESKLVHYTVEKNGELIIDRWLGIEGKYRFWDLVKYTLNDTFVVTFDVKDSKSQDDVVKHVFNIDKNYFENIIQGNGKFTWKGPLERYHHDHKIKLLHLVTEPETNEKEKRSIENLKSFCRSEEHTSELQSH